MLDYRQSVLTAQGIAAGLETESKFGADPSPSTIVVKKLPKPDGTIVYGLVARIVMSQPGFGFRVEHDLPVGVELVEVRPKAKVVGDHLIWQFGRVDPGQEVRLEIVIRPEPETNIRPEDLAIFTATYSHNLYFQVPVVRPRLTARIVGPASVALGERGEFIIEIANVGSCAASNVQATIHIPPGLAHASGSSLPITIGKFHAGELRQIRLPLVAIRRGKSVVRAEVIGPDDKHAAIELSVDVK